jgi:omega-amidase
LASFKAALCQVEIVPGDQESNLKRAEEIVRAYSPLADLVIFPELFGVGYDLPRMREFAVNLSGPYQAAMSALAREHKRWIIAGTAPLLSPDPAETKVQNVALVYDPEGQEAARYAKIHPCGLTGEPEYFVGGKEPVVFDLPWCKAGLLICYDLRFPELPRALRIRGAEVIFDIAQWGRPRADHWTAFLRARAIENQVFMVGVGRPGAEGEFAFAARSAVFGPSGERIVELGDTEEVAIVTIDVDEVEKARRDSPSWLDRRPDVYGELRVEGKGLSAEHGAQR